MKLPPKHLMQRVARTDDPEEYSRIGAECALAFNAAVAEARKEPVRRLLDWGCGPGRVMAQVDLSETELYGCDIDPEAISWAQDNVPGCTFAVCQESPPLPYNSEYFDVVTACSVMTHLSRMTQRYWLSEISRVLTPGGLFVASVHGASLAERFRVDEGTLGAYGILDHYLDAAMNGIATPGYYRATIQTEDYTRTAWAGRFKVVTYQEHGVAGHQDLVVCVKK